jgi:signal transduction histidine kinase/CheY-like chemotaxis protein/HPt (histidine-containing phosphotransfer) domain-containing protein
MRRKINVIATLLFIFLMMVLVVVYTTRLFLRISVSNIYEVGEDKISGLAVTMENYLDTAKSVLWVTADTVDDMISNGDSSKRILSYLVKETKNQEEQFDENYTGIYGYIRGEYLDGLGWTPSEDYDPLTRDWYLAAKEAAGESTIVSPYVDAQTGAVIISFSRLLSDGESALSLDVTMNNIQSIIQNVTIKDKGYGFIVNEDGMIIAHHDASLNGRYISEIPGYEGFWENMQNAEDSNFQTEVNGESSTVFIEQVLQQWYVVIVVSDVDLFEDVKSMLIVNILVYSISFSVIALICFIAYRIERKYHQRVEEMKINEQKQEFEAEVLRLEKSAADASNKAKSDFLAEMSHEIRTPINAVLGMNEMILREAQETNVLHYAENIQDSGKTLLSIVNDILDFSKIEDGKLEIHPVAYDLSRLLVNLVNSIQERAKAKKLELVVEVDEKLPSRLRGDDVRVSQVIMNLLTNAVKYTERGRVTFSVHEGRRDGENVYLDVCVKDTGIGIREEDRAKLFESFERLEEKRNRHIEGTGLGMAIVVKLLSMMESEIHLESNYGKGSAFSFRLRQGIVNAEPLGNYEERVRTSERRKMEKAYLYAPGASILIVDDNRMNLEVAKNLLKRAGIQPDLAISGMEAIEMIRRKFYHVVLLDHMMPKMDGIETLAKLKEERLLGERTAVIALTANAIVGARERYLAAGFDDYLPKPIDSAELDEKLAEYLPKELVTYRNPVNSGETSKQKEDSEIMEFPAMDEQEEQVKDASGILEKVEELGISTKMGLGYCADDAEFYVGIMKDYVEAFSEKKNALETFYQEKNWKEYRTVIHSVKSASKTIGAVELSEDARLLEDAAAQENEAYLTEKHDIVLSEYEDLACKLQQILNGN